MDVCVVTGAGRGLGRAIALHVAATGVAVGICARTESEVRGTADDIVATGGSAYAEAVDVADPLAMQRFADSVEAELGPARSLVNNAGVLGPVGRIDQVDLTEWRRAVDVNVAGAANACAAFVPQMARLGGGSIVNLSGGGLGGPGVQSFISAYTSSKAAVAVLTETVARELAPLGIRVNAVAPGALATELMRPALDAGREIAGDALYETAVKIFETAGPSDGSDALGREFAALLDFLLSDRSAGVTGRLLSSRWESPERLLADEDRIGAGSLFTLRRIDDTLFGERDPG